MQREVPMSIDLDRYEFYIRPGYTDMRKGVCSLAAFVEQEMGKDPYDHSVYLFSSTPKGHLVH